MITDEEARYWWDRVLGSVAKKRFLDTFDNLYEREKHDILRGTKYDEFGPNMKQSWKEWIMKRPIKENGGIMLHGKRHKDGGIKMKGKDGSNYELEDGEQIINRRSGKIKDHIVCEGTGEGIGSALNELGGGIKWSNEGKCKIMENGGKKEDYFFNIKPEIIVLDKSNKYYDKTKTGSDKIIFNYKGNKYTYSYNYGPGYGGSFIRDYWDNHIYSTAQPELNTELGRYLEYWITKEKLASKEKMEKGNKVNKKELNKFFKDINGKTPNINDTIVDDSRDLGIVKSFFETDYPKSSGLTNSQRMVVEYGDKFLELNPNSKFEIIKLNMKSGSKIKNYLRKGRKIEDKLLEEQALKDAEGGYMENGGYAGKTPEQVWNNWTYQQRSHFLYDHNLDSEYWKDNWNELTDHVKQHVKGHIMMGQYENGGQVEKMFIKINEYDNFKLTELLRAIGQFEDQKIRVINNEGIYMYGNGALQAYLDDYGINYTLFENEQELNLWILDQLPKRIKNKLP